MSTNFTRRDFIATGSLAALAATTLPAWAQGSPKITVAFVGVAHIHISEYLDIAKNRPDVRVKYVWDREAARATHRAGEVGAEAVTDLNVIWNDKEISTVIILSETNQHRDLVLAAAKAGKHMFVEKPLGITAAESKEMAAAIEKAGVRFSTGYFNRVDPKQIFVKQQIDAGNFGQITRVRASNCHSGSLGGWFDTDWRWMADPKIAGVGAFGDLGTHKLDILMWMLGEVQAVTGDIRAVTHRYGDCDETGEAMIQFKNGVIGTLAAGWVDIEDPVTLLVSGTHGHAVIFNGELYYRSEKVPGSDARKPVQNLPPAPREPMQQFLDAVAGNPAPPMVTPGEAAARVVVMEAIYKGAAHKKWVAIA